MIHFFSTAKNESLYYEERPVIKSYQISKDAYGDLESYVCKENPSIRIKPLYGFSTNRPTSYALYYKDEELGVTSHLKDCKMVAEYIL